MVHFFRLLLALLCLTACKKEAPPEVVRPVKAIQVQESSAASDQINFPGTLRAFQRADLSFRVDGIVIKRDIIVGQKVKKDETLIQLDPREYELALQKAQGTVVSTQSQLDFASRDFERMTKIYEKDPGAISLNLLDRKKESKNQLVAQLSVAQSELDKATDNLSYTTLKAPFAGIIAAIYVENHEQVRAKQIAVRLMDTGDREMEINIPEKFINLLLEGRTKLTFNVYLDAFPDKVFPGSIKEIGTEASSTTQTYPIILTLHDIPLDQSLLAGMSGKAVLQQAKVKKSIHLPKSAIFSDNLNNVYVWVFDPDSQTVRKRTVKLEQNQRGDLASIQEGLKPGDWVVTAGTSFLSEGQKVKLAGEPAK
ncbi:MAG: efflux RND transporter periplasmic adaptor subunit [Parachlamydia sp.]|nr:efflux RND transporter periplasmic adaptor subunit [Parachlamydia sp.]